LNTCQKLKGDVKLSFKFGIKCSEYSKFSTGWCNMHGDVQTKRERQYCILPSSKRVYRILGGVQERRQLQYSAPLTWNRGYRIHGGRSVGEEGANEATVLPTAWTGGT
jgi:hypothetical protein